MSGPVMGAMTTASLSAAVFAMLRDAVLLTDSTFTVVDCNPAAERLFGMTRDEILGSHPSDLYGLPDQSPVHQALRQSIRDTGEWTGDMQIAGRPDRAARIAHVIVSAIRDDVDGFVGAVGIIRDVTEERRGAARERELQARHQAMLDLAPIGLCMTGMDGRIMRANGKLCEITGYPQEQIVGMTFQELTHPDDVGRSEEELRRLIAGETSTFAQEKRYRRADGRVIWAQVAAALMRDPETGEPSHFVTTVEDVTQRRLATERLTEIASAQLAIADVELSPQKVMNEICRHAQALTGADGAGVQLLEGDELVVQAATGTSSHARGLRMGLGGISGVVIRTGETMLSHDTEHDPRVLMDAARAAIARSVVVAPLQRGTEVLGVVTVTATQAHRFSDDDSQTLTLLAAPFGVALANAWQLEQTSQRATTDALTGLPNRSSAVRSLELALHRQAQHGGHTAVLFVDLDGFKQVNDSRGHDAGDAVLVEVAERMRRAVRARDVAARWGGDEFLFVCDDLTRPEDAVALAQRLLDTLPGGYALIGDPPAAATIGASIGVSVADRPVMAQVLLRSADEAMYQAKQSGGNRYVVTRCA